MHVSDADHNCMFICRITIVLFEIRIIIVIQITVTSLWSRSQLYFSDQDRKCIFLKSDCKYLILIMIATLRITIWGDHSLSRFRLERQLQSRLCWNMTTNVWFIDCYFESTTTPQQSCTKSHMLLHQVKKDQIRDYLKSEWPVFSSRVRQNIVSSL